MLGARGNRCSIMGPGDMSCADAHPSMPRLTSWCWAQIRLHREFRVPQWWRLGLARGVVLAAGLIVAAATEGG